MYPGSQPAIVSFPPSSLSSAFQGQETDISSYFITQGISRSPWCTASSPLCITFNNYRGPSMWVSTLGSTPNNTKNHQSFETASQYYKQLPTVEPCDSKKNKQHRTDQIPPCHLPVFEHISGSLWTEWAPGLHGQWEKEGPSTKWSSVLPENEDRWGPYWLTEEIKSTTYLVMDIYMVWCMVYHIYGKIPL